MIMAQPYYIKVVLEAGKHGEDRPYQRYVFDQNYADHNQQVEEQTALFPAIAKTALEYLVSTSEEYSEGGGEKGAAKSA
jgi:hypothetical protein